MKVGWIGLGSIGAGMATRILKHGHQLTAYARGDGQVDVLAAGGALQHDYAMIAASCEVLGVCVFSDAQLDEVLLASHALSAMKPGSVLAVHTTGSPHLARRIAESAPDGVETLDACFSGGAAEVGEGALTLMIGGSDVGLDRARPILECYASNLYHVGSAGAGQTAKLLNNLLFATNLQFAAQIIRLAADQGLDAALTAQVCQHSSGASRAMGMFATGRAPDTVLANVQKYMAKDVEVAETSARALNLDFSLFEPVRKFYCE